MDDEQKEHEENPKAKANINVLLGALRREVKEGIARRHQKGRSKDKTLEDLLIERVMSKVLPDEATDPEHYGVTVQDNGYGARFRAGTIWIYEHTNLSLKELAAYMSSLRRFSGPSKTSVYKWTQKAGVSKAPGGAHVTSEQKARWKRCAELIEKGWTYSEIAEHLECSRMVPERAAAKYGLSPDPAARRFAIKSEGKGPKGWKRKQKLRKMGRLRLKGHSYEEIGELTGFSTSWVKRLLRESPLSPLVSGQKAKRKVKGYHRKKKEETR